MDSKLKLSWKVWGSFWLTWEGLGNHFRVILAVLAALEGLLQRLGLVLGSSWAVLKASWTVLEGSWELLGGLGSVLATSWELSWRLWGVILGMSGASRGRKTM